MRDPRNMDIIGKLTLWEGLFQNYKAIQHTYLPTLNCDWVRGGHRDNWASAVWRSPLPSDSTLQKATDWDLCQLTEFFWNPKNPGLCCFFYSWSPFVLLLYYCLFSFVKPFSVPIGLHCFFFPFIKWHFKTVKIIYNALSQNFVFLKSYSIVGSSELSLGLEHWPHLVPHLGYNWSFPWYDLYWWGRIHVGFDGTRL